jgi:hypothetical protein
MGEKAIAEMQLQAALEQNRLLREAAYDRAEAEERRLAHEKASMMLANPPALSESWGQDMFGPISDN